jgi:hypothetical protein
MSKWTKHVTNYFRNMRKTNKNYKFKDAMTDARPSYKKMSGGEGDAAAPTADPVPDATDPVPPATMNKETVGGKGPKLDLGGAPLRAAALGASTATAATAHEFGDSDSNGDLMEGGRRKKMGSSKKSKKGGKKSSKNGRKTAKKYGKK